MGWGILSNVIDKCSWIPGPIGTIAGYMTDAIEVGVAIYSGAGRRSSCKADRYEGCCYNCIYICWWKAWEIGCHKGDKDFREGYVEAHF